jgi:hypothetical protein
MRRRPHGFREGHAHSAGSTPVICRSADPCPVILTTPPMTRKWDALAQEILAPALHIPSSPLTLAGFGMHAIQSASSLVRCVFRGPRARALFAGLAAHSIVALDQPGTSAIGLALAAAVTLRVGQSHAVARNKLRRRWRPCSDRPGESSNLDWALDGIPWRNPECARAGTVHLGGPSKRSRRERLRPGTIRTVRHLSF